MYLKACFDLVSISETIAVHLRDNLRMVGALLWHISGISNIEDITRVVISYEIYETSLRRVS